MQEYDAGVARNEQDLPWDDVSRARKRNAKNADEEGPTSKKCREGERVSYYKQ